MWFLRLLFMKLHRRPDLSPWPAVRYFRSGRVIVSGTHASLRRYEWIDKAIAILLRFALIAVVLFGLSMLVESDPRRDGYAMRMGHQIAAWLPAFVVPYVINEGGLTENGWIGIFVMTFLGGVILRALNRPLLAGWLLGRRTTVHISAGTIWWRRWMVSTCLRRNPGVKIDFRATEDPKRIPVGAAPHMQSFVVEVLFGERRIFLTRTLGSHDAERFGIACKAALLLADELAAEKQRRKAARIHGSIHALE